MNLTAEELKAFARRVAQATATQFATELDLNLTDALEVADTAADAETERAIIDISADPGDGDPNPPTHEETT